MSHMLQSNKNNNRRGRCDRLSVSIVNSFGLSLIRDLEELLYFFKIGQPGLFFVYFLLFKQTIQLLQQVNVKKCQDHPVYSTWIRTHNLSNMSRLP